MSTTPPPSVAAPGTPEAWQATRAQTALATQILRDTDDDATADKEIGRPVGSNERELFVSCAPPEALQQQIDHLHPEFIAVHDVGTTSSRRLLAGIAAGWLKVPIEGVFPLAEAAEMHRRLEGRHVAGKLLLKAA